MPSPIESSHDHLTEIGRIAVRWSSLDFTLVKLIAESIEDENIAEAIYFTPISQRARLDMVRTVINAARRPTASEKSEISKLLESLGNLWIKRNELMHNPIVKHYGKKAEPEMIARITRPANAKNPKKEMSLSLSYLKDHSSRLEAIAERLFQIAYARELRLLENAKKHPTWRGKSRKPVPQG
jgi:hypothetical protein